MHKVTATVPTRGVRLLTFSAFALMLLLAGCSSTGRLNDPGLRAQIEAVPPVDLHSHDNPTRDPRVVNALWNDALLRAATPVEPRAVQRTAAAVPATPGRPLLVVAAQTSTPAFSGALPLRDPRSPDFPASVTGRLFFTVDGVPRTCTAQVISSGTGNVLATAGHCLLSSGADGPRRWAQNLMFIPGYRDGAGPLGRWFAADVAVTAGWERGQDWSQDVGFVRVQYQATSARLQQLSGALGAVFGSAAPARLSVVGYPAAGRFDGNQAISCRGAGGGPPDPADPSAFTVLCDMTAGYSGGPWISADRPDELLAVSSHDYGNGRLYGARLDAEALEAFRRVDTRS